MHTPLTERCYLSILNAMQSHSFACLAGPMGTGKTETCKDLAQMFAFPAYVQNCSDMMTFDYLVPMYRHWVKSGGFLIFDEFNRLQLGTLSKICEFAGQIM